MEFNLQRHCRLAGAVVIVAGAFLNNILIILIGNLVMAWGYMWSVNKIETFLETKFSEEKEDE